MTAAHPTFTLVLALAAGVLAQSIARRLRLPAIVLLLCVGAGLGPDGLGWVRPRELGVGLFAIVDIAVAVILFEGGLNLQINRLRREQSAIRRLVTWGALLTLAGGTWVSHELLGWDWRLALLFGSLVVVTGPTVVGPLVSELRLKTRVATVLGAEGVLIDPVGALLAVLALEIALAPDAGGYALGARDLLFRVGFGAAAGVGGGFLLARLLRVHRLLPEGHENIFVLAAVLLLFQGCEELVSHSGIVAVTLSGVVVGNLRILADRDLREFKDQLTILLIGLLFVVLAADVRFDDVVGLGLPGVGVVAALVFVVRPIEVAIATLGTELSWRERFFVMWIAPRGIVAAAIASLVAVALDGAGIAGGTELRALVFLTIGCTVLQAGLTGGLVSRLLSLRQPGRDLVAILGAEGVGLALGRELREGGRRVVFLDSNPQSCRAAEDEGFAVVYGNAMEERTLRRARFENVGLAVALTPNQTVNSAFVSRARELFRVPEALVAVERLATGLASDLVREQAAKVAFDGPHDLARWNVRLRRDDVSIERRSFFPPEAPPEGTELEKTDATTSSECFLVLAVRRGGRVLPMYLGFEPKEGDEAVIAIHEPDRADAETKLQAQGWQPVAAGDEPANGDAPPPVEGTAAG